MASTVPPELLVYIFEMTDPRRDPQDVKVNSFMCTVALLNKAYLNFARRKLYSEVHLSVEVHDSSGDVVRSFAQTVSKSPELASMVRGIWYGGGDNVTEDETRDLADAIACCHNLVDLRVFGYEWFAARDVIKAITALPNLETLEISTFTLSYQYTTIFSMLPAFFSMLQSLRDIRSVIVHPQTIGWDRDQSPFIPSDVIPGACSQLTRFVYGCGHYWDSRHFLAFSRLAPSLSILEFTGTLTGLRNDTLSDALWTWSETLTELTLLFPTTEAPLDSHGTLGIDEVIARMPVLRMLRLSTSYVLPGTFARGPANLERLEYKLRDGQLVDLMRALRSRSAVPKLRVLGVWRFNADEGSYPEGLEEEGTRALTELCEDRGIRMLPGGPTDYLYNNY